MTISCDAYGINRWRAVNPERAPTSPRGHRETGSPSPVPYATVDAMPGSRPTDYEDEPETRVEQPLRTRYDRETRQLLIDEPAPNDLGGPVRKGTHRPARP